MTGGFTLRLEAVPPGLALDLLATLDGLHREVQVAGLDSTGEIPVARETHDVIVRDRDRLEGPRNSFHDQAAAARAAGLDRVDLTADYGPDDVARARATTVAMGEADAAARRGELLASPMTPAVRHLWLWVGAQLEAQAAGAAPTPYDPGA
ncbi:MAG TPA: hypothetical protein VFU19_13115 [Iamia sp.]|nr:hypothetical protein [Iamia sp.]